jgi:hypothetical protein
MTAVDNLPYTPALVSADFLQVSSKEISIEVTVIL